MSSTDQNTAAAIPATACVLPVTVDIVALTVEAFRLRVLLVRRGIEPFLGQLALPGGFVLAGETLEDAARRELAEETGLIPAHIEQLRSYGPLDRDPRGPVLTVAYLAVLPSERLPHAGTDAEGALWSDVGASAAGLESSSEARLAFDHSMIVRDGIERMRAKLEYSPLATYFCRETFTVAELRAVYEAVWGMRLDHRNFHRKVTGTEGFLVPTGERTVTGQGRPAELFRKAEGLDPWAAVLYPPLLRPASGPGDASATGPSGL